jgi:hypothetical protein
MAPFGPSPDQGLKQIATHNSLIFSVYLVDSVLAVCRQAQMDEAEGLLTAA